MIYTGFNAPGIPRDLGIKSICSSSRCWSKLGDALGQRQDIQRFIGLFDINIRETVVSRLQLITFWALYTQKGHTTPKTFFTNIRSRELLGPTVLDPTATLPQDEVNAVLRSIFYDKARLERNLSGQTQKLHLGEVMPPFATPFGASVLRCTFPECNVGFYSPDDLKEGAVAAANRIRARRAKHFAEVFGIPGAFQSQTGLPDPTLAPKAPTSYHNTLHISIARAWSRLSLDRKKVVISTDRQYPGGRNDHDVVSSFIASVRHEICARSQRGNIYSATIDGEFRSILPSFLHALKVASDRTGLDDCSGAAYVHDWTRNTIIGKMEYELGL